jgi:hypothetical protein
MAASIHAPHSGGRERSTTARQADLNGAHLASLTGSAPLPTGLATTLSDVNSTASASTPGTTPEMRVMQSPISTFARRTPTTPGDVWNAKTSRQRSWPSPSCEMGTTNMRGPELCFRTDSMPWES